MATWKLSTEIEPNYNGGLIRAKWMIGGIRTVKTRAQRNSLPYLYRYLSAEESTIIFVEDESQLYKLINNPASVTTDGDWELINLGNVSSSLAPIGTWNVNNLEPEITDEDAAGVNGNFYFVTGSPTPQTITITGLFEGAAVTVVDGNMIVSVGTRWVVVSNSSSWNSIDKPQSIVDYVNGTVIAHNHTTANITDLGTYLADYLTRSNTADHTIEFDLVADTAIPELEFLKTHYYTKQEVNEIINDLSGGGGGANEFLDLLDTPAAYTGAAGKFLRVTALEDALEFAAVELTPFSDALDLIKNATDITKLAKFSAASITTATTRTYTLPDLDGNLMIGEGVRKITVSDTEPTSPALGDVWFDTIAPTTLAGYGITDAWNITGPSTITTPTIVGNPFFQGSVLIANASATITASTSLDVRGISSGNIFRFANSTNTQRFHLTDAGALTASLTSLSLVGTSTFTLTTDQGATMGLTAGGISLSANGSTGVSLSAANVNAYVTVAGNPSTGAVGETLRVIRTYQPVSGTQNHNFLHLLPTWNTTGTYAGTVRGIYYNPTNTNLIGATHIALETTSGQILFGNSSSDSPTASTRFDVRGISGGNIFRLSNSTNTQRFVMADTGVAAGTTSSNLTWDIGFSAANTFTIRKSDSAVIEARSAIPQFMLTLDDGTQKARLFYSSGIRIESLDNTEPITVVLPTVSNTSGTFNVFKINQITLFNPTSGTATFNCFALEPQYEVTGGTTTIRGVYYNPQLTSITGATHIAWESVAGQIRFGGITEDVNKTRILAIDDTTGRVFWRADSSLGGGVTGTSWNDTTKLLSTERLALLAPQLSTIVFDITDNQSVLTYETVNGLGNDPLVKIYQGQTSTTSSSSTSVAQVVIPANTAMLVVAYVIARRTGGTAGTAEDCAAYELKGLFQNIGGTATLVGTATVNIIGESVAGYNVSFVPSGANVLIFVTGVADTNIDWHAPEVKLIPLRP